MQHRYCEHCDYELIGLGPRGKCPECGEPYGVGVVKDRREPLLVRHGASMGLGVLTLMMLICGGVLSLWSTKPVALIATTVAICVVFGGGAVAAYFAEKNR